MKYLKKFENNATYEAAESGLILPNVSLVTENNAVHYNPYVDPYGGHEYVEIGGLKWATMNVGASSVTDTGLYFAWADTQGYTAAQVGSGEGQKVFNWENYKYWTGDTGSGSSGFTKYNSTDGKTVLEASDDAVKANWGGSWRMPTITEYQSLLSVCSIEWMMTSGIMLTITADTIDYGKQLFFPAAGLADYSVNRVGYNGYYWLSNIGRNSMWAKQLYYDIENEGCNVLDDTRYKGCTIRPVAY